MLRLARALRRAPDVRARQLRGFASEPMAELTYGETGIAAGVPAETFKRKAIIYAPARTAGQSGMAKTVEKAGKGSRWKIRFEALAKWENPLMGWTSTADPLEQVSQSTLAFQSKEDAISYCKKMGLEYFVKNPKLHEKIRPKRYLGYGDNFSVKRRGYPEGGLASERDTEPAKG